MKNCKLYTGWLIDAHTRYQSTEMSIIVENSKYTRVLNLKPQVYSSCVAIGFIWWLVDDYIFSLFFFFFAAVDQWENVQKVDKMLNSIY